MIRDIRMILTRLFTVALLMMISMAAEAKADVELNKEYKGGKVKVKSQEDQPDGSTLVTITVTPDQGFTITHSDKNKGIIVVAVRPTSGQSGTRAPEIAGDLTVTGPTETVSYPNSVDYQFTVPAGLNAWVQDIKFQDSGRKDGDDPDPEPVDPDYSGFYYIASSGGPSSYAYSSSNRANNFYLCPATQCFYNPSNNTNFLTSDNGMPHLTTYKSFAHDAVSDAIWHVTSVTVSGTLYYRFYHLASEKYLTYNTGRSISNNQTRLIVHLEAAVTPDENNTLFIVTPSDGKFLIRPKNVTDETKALNVSSDNLDQTNPGPNKGRIQGTIGYYNITGNDVAASYWYFEKAVPEISFTADDKVELSFPITTATIRYTTDGTIPEATTGTLYGSSAIIPDANGTCIKAVALLNGGSTDIAFEPVLAGSLRTYLFHSLGYQSTSQDGFFMQPGDVDNNSNITVTTSSLARPQMQWYFKAAGKNAGYNYFYIVNNTGDYYLYCNSSGGIYMKPSSDFESSKSSTDFDSASDEYKFRILMDASNGYRIVPKAKPTVWIYKNEGNNSTKAVGTSNNTTNLECRWEIIPVLSHEMPAELRPSPFTPSNTTSTAYYKIGNVGDATKFIVPGTTHATTAADSESDEMKWFFLEPSADSSDDWLDYYYIVNAVSGKYLYFCGNETTIANTNAFKTQDYSSTDDDKYRFVVAKTTESASAAGGKYYIVPKVLKDLTYTNYSLVWRDNNNALKTNSNRADNARKWTFTSTSFNCHEPVIEWSASDGGYIITATEPDAKIYYMIGEGTLTPSTGTLYTGAISVAELSGTTATIRAIVARCNDESDKSPEASVTVSKVEIPVVTLTEDGKVQLTCETEGSRIYYEIGNTAESVNNPTTTNSTLYSGLIENAAGKYIKAIAVKDGWINSAVAESGQIVFFCAKPVIRKASATTFTISCSYPTSGVSIYYTRGDNPVDPTTSSSFYNGVVTFDINDLPFTIKAIAVATGYNDSEIATLEITESLTLDDDGYHIIASNDDFMKFITMADGVDFDKKYKITVDINASGTDAITTPFTGELMGVAQANGTFPVISNLDHPIFNTVDGGVVKNIMMDKVGISGSGNKGTIAGVASGYTRIYNCGILPTDNSQSSVASSDGYCGGLVGWLKDDSRVINCFSYANINGGTDVAGIVGHNEAGSTTEETTIEGEQYYSNLRTAVVNCMFYGNITGGSNRYPVYGGAKMVNNTSTGINNYDFYRAEASVGTLTDYNCSWPAKEEYLTQYEFYRNLLNSNRELCGWWVGAPSAPSTMTTTEVQRVAKDASLMAKWVLDTDIAPYPILKKFGKYTSPVNIDANASWRITANDWEGKKMGTLSVTAESGSGSSASDQSLTLVITDMDTLRTDYCYRKVQLPYYNTVFGNPAGDTWAKKYGGNYGDNVVIGWKVSVKEGEGTVGELSENWETGYNFADRNCTAKDANRVFAQGGYYYVPNGVENITITAQWASAIYLDNTDRYYDRVSVSSYTNDNNVYVGSSTISPFEPAGIRPETLGNGKTVQNGSISGKMPSGGSVYGNAIVLVGNHQSFTGGADIGTSSKGGTIMSADFDSDEEPDYCLIWQLGTKVQRQSFCPIRFDFLPIVELGLAMKEDGSTQYYSLGCYRPLGHFEVTETSLIHFGQFEFSNKSRSAYAPIILNGGIFDQYAKGTNNNAFSSADDKINYIILGGNVRMPSFTPGAHVNQNAAFPTRHCAVNILGGNIDNLYLTGNYNDDVKPNTDDPHCYIDGGRLKHVAAAGKEGIDGDVYFFINHSKIWEFYGGSTMDLSTGDNYKIVKGNIDVAIDNSIVDKYCGGPKFGDMIYDEDHPENGKTITTRATGTTFGVYYGGGNGGTSYVQYDKSDGEQTVSDNFDWKGTGKLKNYTVGGYRSGDANYMADYDMEIVNLSTGTNQNRAVYRSYFFAAQFSATNTGSITNNLTDCTVLTNFYGGGNLGGVKGNVTSTLTDTKVNGSAFGAGFSATVPDVTIHNKDKEAPTINVYTGVITPQSGGTSTTYTWCYKNTTTGVVVPSDVVVPGNVGTGNPSFVYNNKNYYYTEVPLVNLGAVTGAVSLTITGSDGEGKGSVIGTAGDTTTGNVYGGGDASAVKNETNPESASTTVTLSGNTRILGNVFGGGNNGEVSGSATVNIEE